MIEDMTIRKFARYAPTSRDRRASIRHDEGANGGDTLPDQNTSKSRRQVGSFGSGLQPDAGHEHPRDQAPDSSDRGLRSARSWLRKPTSIYCKLALTRPRPISEARLVAPLRRQMDRATFMRAELFADRRAEEVGIIWPSRPVSPLIEAHFVCGRSAYETRFANTNGRANREDKVLINAVVADPGRQISRRYCAAAEKGWRDRGRQLILRCGRVRGNQKHQTCDAAEQ
jgi:hypothetical protein